MKKRILSMILSLVMLISLLPTAAFAAGGDYDVDIVASRFSTVQYNEKDTMRLDFMLKTSDDAKVLGVQTALIYVDLEKFDIIQRTSSGSVMNRTETVSTGETVQKKYAYDSFYDEENDITLEAKTTYLSSGTDMLMSFEADFGSTSVSLNESNSLMSVLLGLKEGVTWDDLTADSVRLATREEADKCNEKGVITIKSADNTQYAYLSPIDGTMELTVTPVFETDDSFTFADSDDEGGEDVNPPATNTNYEVYYQITGTDSDNDNFVEIDPNGTFEVGVWVKSTDGSTRKMQAFDIYPTWDSMLSYVSVAGANGVEIEAKEMQQTNPHFYSVMTDLNLDVPAGGVQIATMTLKLSADAVYNTGYNVGLNAMTNLAVALNAESVPVTVDTAAKGAETLKTYAVTYDANAGGESVTDMPVQDATNAANFTKGHNAEMTLSSAEPQRTGYEFLGWDTNPNAETATYDKGGTLPANVNAPTTLYAIWSANTVNVTLNANGGKFSADSNEKTITEIFNGTYVNALKEENKPSRDGYTFAGWSLTNYTDATNDLIADETPVSNANAHTLYAQWTPNNYTVKFDGNEADSGSVADVTVAYNVEFTMPENGFTRTGWKFNGWNTVEDGTGTSYTAGTKYKELTTKSEITLYAQWTQASYDVDVDSGIQNGKVELNKEAANYQDVVNVTVTPNDGYNIERVFYYLTADADKADKTTYPIEVGNDGNRTFQMPAADVTVSATFTAIDYTVTVDSNIVNGKVEADKTEQVHVGEEVTLTLTPDAGYKVGSVSYTPAGGTAITITAVDGKYTFTMPAADVTVSATFVGQTYKVTLNPGENGKFDGDETGTRDVTYGDTYGDLPTPNRTGHEFLGWYTEENGQGTKVKSDTVVNTVGNHTLYAHWEANTYTITFVTNGGTFAENSGVVENKMTYTYGDASAKLPAISKNLHNLVNWTVSYEDGQKVMGWGNTTEGTVTIAKEAQIGGYYSNVILTANWEAGFTYEIEDYKYAPEGYVMLRIATADNTNAYAFDSAPMYYTEDENYKLGEKAVFVTLIPTNVEGVAMVNDYKLTTDGLNKISRTDKAAEVIQRDGRVNMKDTVVNIADANAVYQMLTQSSRGGYYGWDQLGILSRLEADMDTAIIADGENKSEHRGSILDVHKIVNIINENANPTTTG